MKRAAIILALLTAASPGAAAAQGRGLLGSLIEPNSLGAGWRQQQDEARAAVQSGRHISLAQAIDVVRRDTPGRAMDAGKEMRGGRSVYRVRWMSQDGRRLDFLVDAESGDIIGRG